MIIGIKPPLPDELEITTLGPGSSSGESIVVHLKDDEWIIIDSCKIGGKVLPLEYLSGIDVDCEKQVKMVICTHWHTDHIQGMPEILSTCKHAHFYVAPVGDFKGYLDVILKLAGIDPLGSNVWNTMNKCLEALATYNHREMELLGHNERFIHNGDNDVFVIGPSDELYNRFGISLLNIDPNKPTIKDIEELEGNLCSLALSISFKGQKILIGGDMEAGRKSDDDKYNAAACKMGCVAYDDVGWCNAIKPRNVFADEKPYHFVKLPHHSSVTAYCQKMWEEGMVKGGPIATTTAFRCAKGEDLPRSEMLKLYKSKCKELYITNSDGQKEKTTTAELEGINGVEVIDEYTEHAGIIVSRWHNEDEGWNVQCFGEARLVDDAFLQSYHVQE